jgi:hypothetical protein
MKDMQNAAKLQKCHETWRDFDTKTKHVQADMTLPPTLSMTRTPITAGAARMLMHRSFNNTI